MNMKSKNKMIIILFIGLSFITFFGVLEGLPQAKSSVEVKSFCFKAVTTELSAQQMDVENFKYLNANYIDENHVWLGLTFTEDGGRTWKRMVITPEIAKLLGIKEHRGNQDSIESNLKLFFLDKKRGWLSTCEYGDGSTWKTEDGGYTWVKIISRHCLTQPFFLHGKKHGWFVASSYHGPTYIFATNDAGKSWIKSFSYVPKYGAYSDVYFVNETTGYTVVVFHPNPKDERYAVRGIAKTTDGGKHWKLLWMSPNPDERYAGLQFVNDKEGWMQMIGLQPYVVYHTQDGGKTWAQMKNTEGQQILSIYFSDGHKGWLLDGGRYDETLHPAGDGPTLLQTMDGGKKWNLIGRKEILSNPAYQTGSSGPFPDWKEGNLFLFMVQMQARYKKK